MEPRAASRTSTSGGVAGSSAISRKQSRAAKRCGAIRLPTNKDGPVCNDGKALENVGISDGSEAREQLPNNSESWR